MQDPRGADAVTHKRVTALASQWTSMGPRGCLRDAMAKWPEWIGPTGIVTDRMRMVV